MVCGSARRPTISWQSGSEPPLLAFLFDGSIPSDTIFECFPWLIPPLAQTPSCYYCSISSTCHFCPVSLSVCLGTPHSSFPSNSSSVILSLYTVCICNVYTQSARPSAMFSFPGAILLWATRGKLQSRLAVNVKYVYPVKLVSSHHNGPTMPWLCKTRRSRFPIIWCWEVFPFSEIQNRNSHSIPTGDRKLPEMKEINATKWSETAENVPKL